MLTLKIDGRELKANEGATILDVARDNGIAIPALCHHEAVKAYGSCRMCMVEISRNGRSKLVTSCLYPVEDGLNVETHSENVLNVRRGVIEFLLARCPNLPVIQNLAKELGIEKPPFRSTDDEKCILCGLCTRVCKEVVGVNAIGMANRGVDRQVATPFFEPSEVCIGCGSCAYVCPAHTIQMKDVDDTRTLTFPNRNMPKTEFKLKKCSVCSRYWAPERQVEYMIRTAGLSEDFFDVCPECKES